MTSFFNSNANALSRSVIGVSQNSGNSVNIESVKDYFRFQALYENALNQMRIDIGYFGQGDFATLNNTLTTQKYNQYLFDTNGDTYYNDTIDIANLVRDPNTFRNYINIMRNVLTGLREGQLLQQQNEELKIDLSNNELTQGIIDEQIIYKFLLNRRGEFVPFDESVLYTQTLDIKLWYSNYLQEWGPPPNGVFDTEKLATIVDKLIAEGVISWEEFLAEETYNV